MIKRLLSAFLVLSAIASQAQDLHFSQYYMSPLTLNPAMTGLFNGSYRFTGNYRNQWQSVLPTAPYRTFAGSVELAGKSGYANRIGGGLHVFTDHAGSLDLSRTSVSGSLGYTMALSRNKDYFFCAGLQASYYQSKFDYLKMTTGSQWENGSYNPSATTGEGFDGRSISFVDAGMGLMWYHFRSIRSYQWIGGSAFHLNRPNLSFSGSGLDKLYAKYTLHAGAGFVMRPRVDLDPYFLFMTQGPSYEVTTGTLLKFILDERKTTALGGTAFYIGPFFRAVGDNRTSLGYDALIIATKLDINAVTMGLSYDINVSSLSRASGGRGGPELAIQYVGAFQNKHVKTYCPKF